MAKFKPGDRVWADIQHHNGRHYELCEVVSAGAKVYKFRRMRPAARQGEGNKLRSVDEADRLWQTEDEYAASVFLGTHPYRIAQAVQKCRDVATLRKVAELVGYEIKA